MRRMWSQTFPKHPLPQPSGAAVIWQGLQLLPGLTAVVGDEGSGKTHLLRTLASAHADALWLDLRLPEHGQQTPRQFWAELQTRQPHWQADWQTELAEALQLNAHVDKALYMLSTGSRRKVALVGLLASGCASLVVLDFDQRFGTADPARFDQPLANVVNGGTDYWHDVKPVLEQRCVVCHGEALAQKGVRLNSEAALAQHRWERNFYAS